ncbi:MAG: hypothetical protein UD299_06765 [Ruminococcus sp.]|jgi:hypothetical protein|nr:hypothetical protein [Ruminococcus sp.]
MNKNTFTAVQLAKGEVNVYDFGTVKLHAYKTNDFIDNEVFIVEKAGKAVILESPCFFDNIEELTTYLQDVEIAGMLVAYHGAGATFLPNVPKYATQNAVEYSENGGGKALITNFTNAFGAIFDHAVHQITNVIGEGTINIGGIDLSFIRPQKHLTWRYQKSMPFIPICSVTIAILLLPEQVTLMQSLHSFMMILQKATL